MALNCKTSDLAIYVGKISPKDVGAIVCCVKFLGDQPIHGGGFGPMWEVYPPLRHSPAISHWIVDSVLRPLRDNPGQDETLQWAPVPHKETA